MNTGVSHFQNNGKVYTLAELAAVFMVASAISALWSVADIDAALSVVESVFMVVSVVEDCLSR